MYSGAFFALLLLSVLQTFSVGDEFIIPEAPPKLLFVAELCRHGDRAPIAEFPSDALPASKWPEGVGQLTAIGQRAHFEIGTRLRARYVDTGFLSSSYSVDEVHVRSTDVDRTLVSAISQMTGLYPPGTAPNFDVRVKFGKDPLHENEGGLPHLFQPIPVHTVREEKILIPGANCPRHKQIMAERYNSDEFMRKTAEEADFLKVAARVAQLPNESNFSLFDLEQLSDTWTCFASHSVPLPKDATPDIVSHARNLSDWLLDFGNRGLQVHRLRAGLILNTVREYMVMAVSFDRRGWLGPEFKNQMKKFVLLSAHDTTVAATLAALRVNEGGYPPYNSTVIWQLYKKQDGTFFVQVEFNGKDLLLPGCESVNCTMEEYMASTLETTIFSEQEREVECMTGVARMGARLMSIFQPSHSRDFESQLGDFATISKKPPGANGLPSVSWIILAGAILFSGLIGVLTLWRVRSRYNGYVTPGDSKSGSESNMAEAVHLANRRILM